MALGRGLSELLGEVETAYSRSTVQSDSSVVELDVESIKPNPNQPRKVFDEQKLQELSQSIKKQGLLQPIVVIQNDENDYTLVAGERRLRAHKLAGFSFIKAIVTDIEEMQLREFALIENIQRDELNIIELAYSYAQLINEHNLTHEELSEKVFKSRSSITNILRLLQLCSYVQQCLANDKISTGHAKVLIGLSEDEQKTIADSIVGQKLSVRETEKLVQQMKNPESSKKQTKKVQENSLDTEILNEVIEELKEYKLNAAIDGSFFKIEIKTQEDIKRISEYFK